jgi:phosphoglycerate dehydrogenase-like enzyme
MVRSDDHLCSRERLAHKEAMNVVDAAAPSPDTRNLLDVRRIGLMKRGASIVNCARGGLIA